MTSIRLSVIMTNYNDSAFLPARISSILEQLGPSDEFLFIDDCSTDQSLSIVKEFALKDPRLKIIENPQNLGVVKSANIGYNAAKGKYLTSLAADDRILPGFVEKTLTPLLENPEYGLCCSDCAMWYDRVPGKDPNKIYTTKLLENIEGTQFFPPQKLLSVIRERRFWIPGHTSIIKRELFLKYGGLDGRLGPLSDWFLIHTIALFHGAIYIPEDLAIWRQFPSSYSSHLGQRKKTSNSQVELFRMLAEKERKVVRHLFKSSKLTNYYVRKNLLWVMLRPKYWDFLFTWGFSVLKNRQKRYWNACKAALHQSR